MWQLRVLSRLNLNNKIVHAFGASNTATVNSGSGGTIIELTTMPSVKF
jgi:hypothetical protein